MNEQDYMQRNERRREREKKRKRQVLIAKGILLAVLVVVLLISGGIAYHLLGPSASGKPVENGNDQAANAPNSKHDGDSGTAETNMVPDKHTDDGALSSETDAANTDGNDKDNLTPESGSDDGSTASEDVLTQARTMAMGYDYDGAIDLLKTVPSYESNQEITAMLQEFETTKATLVPVDVNTVPHIFYHSLINDTSRAFDVATLGQSSVDGMNAWMTTVEEFDKITQAMYDNGYVFVRLRDLVTETTDENGNVSFSPRQDLMLPPDKKAVVLSLDDLSYYHSYEAAGYPDKLVLDENGDVKCHYVKADGTEEIGDFDAVPRLNKFLKEHPDGAYKGARGLIALTGYNGVFGYRTDSDYETQQNLMSDQAKWLEEHPDFNRQEEIDGAIQIAEALKKEGWEFASHTWGHVSTTAKTAEELAVDNEKWVNNVQNIVGPVDTIIFAHGNDIGDWHDYSDTNEKFQYYKSAGYNFFCNVDGSQPYWVQIRSNYVRQGRINLDGYMLYRSSLGQTTVLDNLFLASQVFDQRRPTPVVAHGES